MKRICLIVLAFVFLSVGVVSAEGNLKIRNGEIYTSSGGATGIEVSPEVQKYPEAVKKAYNSKEKEEKKMVGLFHYDTVAKVGVAYNSQSGTIDTVSLDKKIEERIASPYFLFWVSSVALFLFALIVLRRGRHLDDWAIDLVGAIFGVLALNIFVIIVSFAFDVFSGICALIAFFAAWAAFFALPFSFVDTSELNVVFSSFIKEKLDVSTYSIITHLFLMMMSAGFMYYPLF